MTWPSNAAGRAEQRWLFVIELDEGTEALLRTLASFPAQGAQVATMALHREAGLARLEVTATGLDELRASHLRTRVAALACVRSVGMGWR